MELGAGLLRFVGVLWIVLLYQGTVSGRIVNTCFSSRNFVAVLRRFGSRFGVKRKTLPFIEGAAGGTYQNFHFLSSQKASHFNLC